MIKSLEFTLSISKCLNCLCCPQDKLNHEYAARRATEKLFTAANFSLVLNKLPKDVRIDFSGYSEPFLNPLCAEFIKMASDAGREIHLFTTLVGLKEVDLDLLRGSNITHIRIHVPDMEGLKTPSNLWLKNLDLFMKLEKPATYMAMSETIPNEIILGLMKHQVRSVDNPQMLGRGGNLWETGRIDGPIRCNADRWHQNVILPNGSVYVCCMDYGLTMPVGNLFTQSYSEIQEKADEYAANDNPPADSICRHCEWGAPK